jgi:hypothetical protein
MFHGRILEKEAEDACSLPDDKLLLATSLQRLCASGRRKGFLQAGLR